MFRALLSHRMRHTGESNPAFSIFTRGPISKASLPLLTHSRIAKYVAKTARGIHALSASTLILTPGISNGSPLSIAN